MHLSFIMELELVFKIIYALWCLGIGLSVTCLFIQMSIYIVPLNRKLDQKILTQLTIARLLNIVFEYGSMYESKNSVQTCVIIMMYFYSDAALVCWMSVFTKRLYDRIVIVFTEEMNFVRVTVLVWLLSLPIGLICFALMFFHANYIFKFCSVYCIVKCVVLSLNLLVFCRIFRVVFTVKAERNFKSTLKTCIISFLLLSITSIQIFIRFFFTDATPFFLPTHDDYRNSFLILFSLLSIYQVTAITLIFIMILNAANKSDQSILEQIVRKLKNGG